MPWDLLNTTSQRSVLDDPVPFIPFRFLDPACASTDDIYGTLQTILKEQEKGEHALTFSLDRETTYCLSKDQKKAKDSSGQPSPQKAKRKKKSRTILSDSNLLDFSPAFPGNMTPAILKTPAETPAAQSEGDSGE